MRPFYSHNSHKQSHLLFQHSFRGWILSHHHYIQTFPLPSSCTASEPITFTHLPHPPHLQLCLMHIHSFARRISIVHTTSQRWNSSPLPYPRTMYSAACGINSSSNGHLHLLCLTLSILLLSSVLRSGGVEPQGVYWDLSLTPIMWRLFIYCPDLYTSPHWFNHTWSLDSYTHCYHQWIMEYLERNNSIDSWLISLYQPLCQWLSLS